MGAYQDGYDHGGGSPPKPATPPHAPPVGEYVWNAGVDSQHQRTEGERILRANGCLRFRHEVQGDGTLVVHGYLRAE